MYRYDLTDVQGEQIALFFPDRYHHGRAGRPWKDHRLLVNGILWPLHTGAPWPDTPERYGPWQTVYDRCNRWRKDGTWAKILDALLFRLDQAGFLDRKLWLIDASVIRASRAAAGAKKKVDPPPTLAGPEALRLPEPPDHALGRSQGGFGTKVHLVGEGHGTVLAVWVTPGQRHESPAFAAVLLRAKRPRWTGHPRWPQQVAGDKGYSYPGIRQWLRRHHIVAVIPTRKDQPQEKAFDRTAYRSRNLVERVGLVQGIPCARYPLRQIGGELCCLMAPRHPQQTLTQVCSKPAKRIVRKSLVVTMQLVGELPASVSNRFSLGTRALMIAAYGPYVQGAAMAILLYLFPLAMVFLLLPGWGHYLVNYFVVFAWLRSWTVGWALADNITDIVAASGIVADSSIAEDLTALGATTSLVSSILYIAAPFILAILIGGGATALASVLGFSGIGIGSFM